MPIYTTKIKIKNTSLSQERPQFKETNDSSFLIGTTSPKILVYEDGGENSEKSEGMVVNTNITANESVVRLGMKINRQTVTVNQPDRRVGTSIGRVVDYAKEDYVARIINNNLRQGKDVKNYSQAFTRLTPVITFSRGGIGINDEIDHSVDLNVYGQGSLFKIYDEDFKIIPFRDFGKLVPKDLIGKSHVTSYPFVNDLKINFEQFIDPSLTSFDGSVDIFDTKTSLTNTSTLDFIYKGANGQFMGAGIDYNRKGTLTIDNHFHVDQNRNDYFLDSQEQLFGSKTFPQIGVTGSSGNKFAIQGFSSDQLYIDTPFKEKDVWEDDEYNFLTYEQKSVLLSGSNRNISELGRRFKSANNGFIFGESNKLGTDSISFGGFKK